MIRIRIARMLIRIIVLFIGNSYKMQRAGINFIARFYRVPKPVEVEHITMDGIPSEKIRWGSDKIDNVILLLHGGGFVIGTSKLYREVAVHMAKFSNATVYVPDYRLAPEYPYPAAHEDSLKAYNWLLDQGIASERIAITGDSAGGNLTASLLQMIRDCSLPQPACAVCVSPWLNIATANKVKKFNDPMITIKLLEKYAKLYIGNREPAKSEYSPLLGDLNGLPPVLIQTGSEEVLLDESYDYIVKSRNTDSLVKIEVIPDLFHSWNLWSMFLPVVKESVKKSGEFCKEYIEKAVIEKKNRKSKKKPVK
jgi:epsilon-lactone hydrolase